MKHSCYLLILLFFIACKKGDNSSGNAVTPQDTANPSPYPYTTSYKGLMRRRDFFTEYKNGFGHDTAFDTAYVLSVKLIYPNKDSVYIRWTSWGYNDSSSGNGHYYTKYLFPLGQNALRRDDSDYHFGNTKWGADYRLTKDSLIGNDVESLELYFAHSVSFAGKKE